MSKTFRYYYNGLKNKPILVIYMIGYISLIILTPILYLIYVKTIGLSFENRSISKSRDLFSEFTVKVMVGPIIETFLFQKLPIDLSKSRSFVEWNKMIPIFLSAMIFGLMHFSSLYHVVYSFHMGLILASFYYIMMKKNKKALFHTSVLHALFNLTLLLGRNL